MDDRIPRIHSFPRSGTHLLGATLLQNFYSHMDLSTSKSGGGHWRKRRNIGERPFGKMFRPAPHRLGYDLEPGRVHFYIYRDGRDVAVSLWNAKDMIGPGYDMMPFSEFLRAKQDWLWLPSNKADPTMSVVEQWKAHLDSWFPSGEQLLYVSFEELVRVPFRTLRSIAAFLGIPAEEFRNPKPVEEKVGVWPGKGKVGTWRDVFSPGDLDYFFSIVPKNHYGLWWLDEMFHD